MLAGLRSVHKPVQAYLLVSTMPPVEGADCLAGLAAVALAAGEAVYLKLHYQKMKLGKNL